MKALQKVIIGYARYISTLPVESKLPEHALAELAALREAGEKMYSLVKEFLSSDNNTMLGLMVADALEAWEAANK